MKKITNPWDLQHEIKRIVKTSVEKQNKPATIDSKLSRLFDINRDCFKHASMESIWEDRLLIQENTVKAFDFLKQGYFQIDGLACFFKIEEISDMGSYKHTGFVVTLKGGVKHKVSENDYKILKLIIQ